MKCRPTIAFMVDVRNWAYDFRAKKWQQLLIDEFNIDIFYLEDYQPCQFNKDKKIYQYPNGDKCIPVLNHKNYDGILFFFHMAHTSSVLKITTIPREKIAVCINNEKWVADGTFYTSDKYFDGIKILTGSNSFIQKSFSEYHNIINLSQCVDESNFYPITSNQKREFTIGWSGNSNNPRKNLKWLQKACNACNVNLNISTNLNQNELNQWYNNIDVLVCCSLDGQEGGPNCILEAGACKVPVLSTPVGLTRDLIRHNINGILTPHRRLDLLISNIIMLKNSHEFRLQLGENLYNNIMDNWTYNKKLHQIRNVLNKLIEK